MPDGFGSCCQRTEVFRGIPDVPDYMISNLGRVRRETPGKGTHPGRIVQPVRRPDGHFYVYLPPGNGERLRNGAGLRPRHCFIALQRLVVAVWLPWVPDEVWKDTHQIIHHKDWNPAHNCDTNLEWKTRSQHLKLHKSWLRRERDEDDTDGREPKVYRQRPEIRVEPDPWEWPGGES